MNKLAQLIWKDVTGENESNRVSYIVRINAMLMCLYFIILMVVFSVYGKLPTVGTCALCLATYGLAVYHTYKDIRKVAVTSGASFIFSPEILDQQEYFECQNAVRQLILRNRCERFWIQCPCV